VNKITNVTSPYVHSGLTNAATYYYVVTKVSGGVEGAVSSEVSAQPQASIAAKPNGFKVTAGDGKVTLNLVDSTGKQITSPAGTTYNIYWDTGSVTKNTSNKISNVTFPFDHTGLTNTTRYYYAVSSESADGESDLSNEVSVAPRSISDYNVVNAVFTNGSTVTVGNPGGVASLAAYAGNQQVTLSGTPSSTLPNFYFKSKDQKTIIDPKSATVQYMIYWSDQLISSDKSNTKGKISVPSFSTFTHSGLTNGARYFYAVTAVPVDNTTKQYLTQFESPILTQISLIPSGYTPPSPTNITAAAGNQEVDLSWKMDTSGGAVTYNIHWWTAATQQTPTTISGINSKSYSHTGLKSGTTYYYIVTATSLDGLESPAPANAEMSATP
jgi:fibronectin type 3 domain-containing protein